MIHWNVFKGILLSLSILIILSACTVLPPPPPQNAPIKRSKSDQTQDPTPPLVVVYPDQTPPYSWLDEQGVPKGIIVDIMHELLTKRMGIEVIHHIYPSARAFDAVISGQGDAFIGMPVPKCQEFVDLAEEPILTDQLRMYTSLLNPRLKELNLVTQPSQLKGYHAATLNGNNWVQDNFVGTDITYVQAPSQGLKMVSAKRLDIYIENARTIHFQLKMTPIDNIVELPSALGEIQFVFMISKQSFHRDILIEFNRILREAKANGTLKRIETRYE